MKQFSCSLEIFLFGKYFGICSTFLMVNFTSEKIQTIGRWIFIILLLVWIGGMALCLLYCIQTESCLPIHLVIKAQTRISCKKKYNCILRGCHEATSTKSINFKSYAFKLFSSIRS